MNQAAPFFHGGWDIPLIPSSLPSTSGIPVFERRCAFRNRQIHFLRTTTVF